MNVAGVQVVTEENKKQIDREIDIDMITELAEELSYPEDGLRKDVLNPSVNSRIVPPEETPSQKEWADFYRRQAEWAASKRDREEARGYQEGYRYYADGTVQYYPNRIPKSVVDARGRPIGGKGPTKTEMQKFLDSTVDSSTYDKGIGLELFSKRLLEAMGWQIEHSGKSGDGGVDLIGLKSDDLMTTRIVIQCKHQDSVAEEVVVQTFGKAQSENANRAYVITSGQFTQNAKAFADANKTKIVLIDGVKLKELSEQYLDI